MRVDRLFNSTTLNVIQLPNGVLLKWLLLMLSGEFLLLLLWALIDPLQAVSHPVLASSSSSSSDFYVTCSSHWAAWWLSVSLGTKGLLALYSGYLASAVSKVPTAFNGTYALISLFVSRHFMEFSFLHCVCLSSLP